MSTALQLAVEIVVGVLLIASGLLALVAAIGIVRFRTFFQRMHPPALASTLATWCAALATLLDFAAQGSPAAMHPWMLVIVLSITAPVTTTLIARAALFRRRAAEADVPPPLNPAD
jgi:multicomponent K+:H+ antiporter subunit G